MCKFVTKMYHSTLSQFSVSRLVLLTVLGTFIVSMITLRYDERNASQVGYSIYSDESTLTQFASAPVKAGTPILPPPSGPRKQFSDFIYVSDVERTRFGENLYFTYGDTMSGPIWSNSVISFMGGYFGQDTIWAPGLIGPGYNLFVETTTRAHWHRYANEIRYASRSSFGHYIENPGNSRTTALLFHGSVADVWQWESGTQATFLAEPPINAISWSTHPSAIFVEGDLWIQGHVTGKLAIGASGNIRLMDNLVYSDAAEWPYNVPNDSPNYLTVVSEATTSGSPVEAPRGILIANSWTNGRENAGNLFAVGPSNQYRRDIALHGAYIALNGSISFEQQNDNGPYEPYVYNDPTYRYDERGYIYLRGSIAFKKKDYVHRGNTNTTGIRTGYFKSFRYDQRFRTNSPPFQPAITFR